MSKINDLIKKLCPNGVVFKRIGEIANYRRGSFPQPYTNEYYYGGEDAMPFVQVADVKDNFRLVDSTKNTISKLAQPLSVFVPKGTVIVTLQGTIGRVAITQYDAYVDRTLAIFEGLSSELNTKYFVYQLKSKFDYEKQFARGSTIKTITKEEMTEFKIPIPPLEVQEEIVKILDKFGELEAELEVELEVELEARKSQYEFWRGKLFEKENVKYMKISEFAKCYAGATPSTSHSEYWENGTIPWMSSGEVNNIEIYDTEKKITKLGYNSSSTKMLPINTVVVALAGQGKTRGLVAITRKEVCTNQSLCGIVPDERVDNEYLFHYLQSRYKDLRRISSGDGTRGGLNLKMINDYEVPVPDIDEQKKIISVLNRFSRLVNSYTDGIPTEIELRRKQYEYYRNKLLSFEELSVSE